MPHRRQDQRNLLGVVRHIPRLVQHLGHDNQVTCLVRLPQRRKPLAQLVPQDQNQTLHHGTRFPAQSKNCPVSSLVSPSMTCKRWTAASCGVTVGCPLAYFSVSGVSTVPGCSATQIASLWLRPISIAPVWIIWFNAAFAVR